MIENTFFFLQIVEVYNVHLEEYALQIFPCHYM